MNAVIERTEVLLPDVRIKRPPPCDEAHSGRPQVLAALNAAIEEEKS